MITTRVPMTGPSTVMSEKMPAAWAPPKAGVCMVLLAMLRQSFVGRLSSAAEGEKARRAEVGAARGGAAWAAWWDGGIGHPLQLQAERESERDCRASGSSGRSSSCSCKSKRVTVVAAEKMTRDVSVVGQQLGVGQNWCCSNRCCASCGWELPASRSSARA